MKVFEAHKKMVAIQENIDEIPWHVWTSFWESPPHFNTFGSEIGFDGDYKSIEEMRESVNWLVDQFGGKVTWKK